MTAPLVPHDVVIPRLPWVPIYADRLFESDFFAVASDAEFKAAVCLWIKSWNQRPPGSLPNNQRVLCRLAGLADDLDKWRAVRRVALRHWKRCDDGRLYHPVVAELVIEAANRLSTARNRTAAATAARWKTRKPNLRHGVRNGHDLDKTGSSAPKGASPRDTRERADAREGEFDFSNGKGSAAALPAPVNPKTIGHRLPCHCANCLRWVALQPGATA